MRMRSLVCVVCVMGIASMSEAAVLEVDGVGGGGKYATIASAITAAGANDIINITAASITEHSITVNKNLTIQGQGADVTTVQNTTAGMRIFNITGTRTVTFQNLTLTGGDSSGSGGAIYVARWNDVVLTLDSVAVVANECDVWGGAIHMGNASGTSTLTITDSTFSGNTSAGGIGASKGQGGAVYVEDIRMITVENSTFSGNKVTKGDTNWIYGGAISCAADAGLIRNSTFVNNELDNGGRGQSRGNAIYATGGVVDVVSSLFADNKGTNSYDVALATIGTVSYSVGQDDILNIYTIDGGNNNEVVDAKVGALADNGGPTMTHALLAGSPAIDAGSNPTPALTYDQRGPGYVRTYGGGTDAGAYEVVPEPATLGLLGLGSLGMSILRLCRRRRA